MNRSQDGTRASLVVQWPANVGATPAERLAGVLNRAGLASTWCVDEARQVARLSAAPAEVGLLAPLAPASAGETLRKLPARLELARAAGYAPTTLSHRGGDFAAAARPLRAVGIEAVVRCGEAVAPARQLPFGLWQLGPARELPRRVSWWRRIVSAPPRIVASTAPWVIAVDLERLAASSARGWRETERLLAEAARLASDGRIAVDTIAALTAHLQRQVGARTQRSILRAA